MEYIALAIAPGIAICLFIFYRDIYNREPKFNLVISFLLGCAAILPAMFFEGSLMKSAVDGTIGGVAIASYLVIAFSEEGSKFLGLRLYSYNQKSFDEPLDGIVYAVMISMGFATAENIKYVYFDAAPGTEFQIGLMRMFTAVPAHATFAIAMGYFVGKARVNPKKSLGLMLTGLVAAIFLHGTYDFFLLLPQYSLVGQQRGNEYLALGGIASFIISLVLCRKLIKYHRTISQQMFKKNPPPPPSA